MEEDYKSEGGNRGRGRETKRMYKKNTRIKILFNFFHMSYHM